MTSKSPVVENIMQARGGEKMPVLGVFVTIDTREQILQYVLRKPSNVLAKTSAGVEIKNSQSGSQSAKQGMGYARVVVTPNPEQLVYAHVHSWYRDLLNQAEVALPDGAGVVWAVRRKSKDEKRKTIERIAGVDFMNDLLADAARHQLSVAFLGNQSAALALDKAQERYKGLLGWSAELPTLNFENGHLYLEGEKSGKERLDKLLATLTEKIISSHTAIVFVGLGAPKQELLIAALENELRLTMNDYQMILMSVGGSFDILAGKTPRAPKLFRGLSLEWLWRLIIEPWRWRRQLALVRFVWLVLMER